MVQLVHSVVVTDRGSIPPGGGFIPRRRPADNMEQALQRLVQVQRQLQQLTAQLARAQEVEREVQVLTPPPLCMGATSRGERRLSLGDCLVVLPGLWPNAKLEQSRRELEARWFTRRACERMPGYRASWLLAAERKQLQQRLRRVREEVAGWLPAPVVMRRPTLPVVLDRMSA